MSKKILAALLAVLMVLTLVPMTALADEAPAAPAVSDTDAVASIGTGDSKVNYATLAAAITAAETTETTISVVKNTTESITIEANQKITLVFAEGVTLTNQADFNTITNKGNLTIQGNGTVDNVSHGKAALWNDEGTVNLNGCTFTRSAEASTGSDNANGNSFYTIKNAHGQMTIDGATVTQGPGNGSVAAGKFSSLIQNVGDVSDEDGTETRGVLTIKSGTFSGGLNTVKNDGAATLTIDGGTFSNTVQYVVMNWDETTIKDGTFNCASAYSAVLNVQNGEYSKGELNIEGGKFVASAGVPAVATSSNPSFTSKDIEVSGGSFSSPVPFEYLNEDLKYEAENLNNKETPYTYHTTAAAATVAANGGEVKTTNALSDAGFAWGWKDANIGVKAAMAEKTVDGVAYPAITSASAGKDALDQTLWVRADNLEAGDYHAKITIGDTSFVETESGVPAGNFVLRWAYARTGAKGTIPEAGGVATVELYKGGTTTANDVTGGTKVGETTITIPVAEKPVTTITVDEVKAYVKAVIGAEGKGLLGDYTVDIKKGETSALKNALTFGATANEVDGANADEKSQIIFEKANFTGETIADGLYTLEVYIGNTPSDTAFITKQFVVGDDTEFKLPTPVLSSDSVTLADAGAENVTVTLTNADEYEDVPGFEVYLDSTALTKAPATATLTDGELTIAFTPTTKPTTTTTYYIVAVKDGKLNSDPTPLTVSPYNSNPSIPPIDHPNGGGTTVDPNAPTVTIGVTQPENGTLSVEPKQAKAGEQVTVTVTPSEKYYVATSVTAKGDTTVTATKNANGTFTFTMPAGNTVTVTAEIKHIFDLFTDVPAGSFYADPVKWAVEQGITLGNSTDYSTFGTTASCTRKEMVLFLYRAAGEPAITGSSNNFADITGSQYDAYRNAIQWAVDNGITQGTSETTFAPDDVCSRSQMVTFLYRYDQEPAVTGSNSFVDVPADAFYKTAVQWAVNKEVTQGTNAAGTTFEPYTACSRGQMVTFLYRYMGE